MTARLLFAANVGMAVLQLSCSNGITMNFAGAFAAAVSALLLPSALKEGMK